MVSNIALVVFLKASYIVITVWQFIKRHTHTASFLVAVIRSF